MEWIGLMAVMLVAVALIVSGALIALLTGIGGAPKVRDRVQGVIMIMMGLALTYYGWTHAPFTVTLH